MSHAHTIYVTNADMAVTLAQFLSFLQSEGKWIKRSKNHYKHEHVESCSWANRELVISVRDRCSDVTYTMIGCAVFLNTHFQSLMLKLLYNKPTVLTCKIIF